MAMLVKWGPWRGARPFEEGVTRAPLAFTPATDIYEDDEALQLKFELAGVDPKDVLIRLDQGVLTVKGERKLEHEGSKGHYRHRDCSYGTFNRRFLVPPSVDTDQIQAESKDGVLRVRLPKKAAAKPKSIRVSVN